MLRDGRDDPYVTHRAQTESVTFLGNQSENTRNLYAIPGLDYVAHEGISRFVNKFSNNEHYSFENISFKELQYATQMFKEKMG